jgi:hypothetical protein
LAALGRVVAPAALALAVSRCGGAEFRHGFGRPVFDPGPVPAEHAAAAGTFGAFCAGCHGPSGTGFIDGPPLLDTLYLAPRFADSSIRHAVEHGVPQHHWPFGDMPPLRVLPASEVAPLIGYLRWAQARWVAARDSVAS